MPTKRARSACRNSWGNMIMIVENDCIKAMKYFPENYFDALVTDPPYGLIFMGKEWDKLWDKRKFDEYEYAQKSYTCSDGSTRKTNPVARKIKNPTYRTSLEAQLWHTRWLEEAYRILKPGASILVMGGTRTFHRLVCAIEDSGFVIKDCLMWLYGQGFPKAQDITIIIDSKILNKTTKQLKEEGWKKAITSEAKKWEGFKLGGLKPAYEPIIWGVKPFKGSCTDNVLKHGVGAINVDECRIGYKNEMDKKAGQSERKSTSKGQFAVLTEDDKYNRGRRNELKGRFPANIVLDEEVTKILDEQTQNIQGPWGKDSAKSQKGKTSMFNIGSNVPNTLFKDGIGASRFFYCAKASSKEKDLGMGGGERNKHPTVKPIKLFEWLIKLVTKEGQVIFDPFLGTGTTMIAANNINRICVGVEKEKEYCKIAKKRVKYWEKND